MISIHSEDTDLLFEGIMSLKSKDECYKFFEDLCTVNELISMAQRFHVARDLYDGKTFLQIEAQTGTSSATISRVNRCFNYGSGGYKMVIEKLNGEDKSRN